MVEIKRKDFIDAVPITSCKNALQIMGLMMFGDHRFGDSPEFRCYERFFGKDLR